MRNKPFKELKVIELASVLAGPSVGLFFAELGAKVIKIENKNTGGDVTRSWKLPSEKEDALSAYFLSVNFYKKHLLLDLTREKDYEKCITQIKKADIVIVNYKKGDDKKWKLDYRSLKKVNPSIVYASINGFGEKDERLAYDLILQAESGFMSMNGTPESGPVKMPVALVDILAAHQLKEAILIALLKREKTKKGSCVSVSLFDAALASLANQATNWMVAGHLPKRTGSLHPNIAPYGELFETKDKQTVTFAIGSDSQFKKLCGILQLEKIAADKKYGNSQLRVKHRTLLFTALQAEINKLDFTVLQKNCLINKIPFAKIRNLEEVFELPEAKKMLRKISHKQKNYTVVSSVAFS